MPADSNVSFLKMARKIAPATFTLTTSSLVCSGKRWFRAYHSMLCISFPRQYICLFQSLFLSFLFSHFPILLQLHGIFYYEYWIPKWYDFQKIRRQKRFTDSITVSVHSSVLIYYACYKFRLLHHRLILRYFLQC